MALPITYQGKTYDLSDPAQQAAYSAATGASQYQATPSTVSSTGLTPQQTQELQSITTQNQAYYASQPGTLASQLGQTTTAEPLNVEPYEATPLPELQSYSNAQLPQRNLPEAPQAPDLVGLADALDYAGQLAKTKRNELLLGVMKPSSGVAPASDFNGILNNLNRAGVSFIEGQAQRVFDMANQQYSAQKEAFNRAYELALSDYEFQRSLVMNDIDTANQLLLKKWEVENSVSEKNYDLKTKLAVSQQEEAKSQAQTEKTNIQQVASQLASDGAPQDIVNSVLNAGNLDSAISISSGWYNNNEKLGYKLEQVGDTVYKVTYDEKTGEPISKEAFITNPDGNAGGNAGGNAKEDIAQIVYEFKQKMEQNGWRGVNPDDYEYYKNEIIRVYGYAALEDFEKALKDSGLYVDYGQESFGEELF